MEHTSIDTNVWAKHERAPTQLLRLIYMVIWSVSIIRADRRQVPMLSSTAGYRNDSCTPLRAVSKSLKEISSSTNVIVQQVVPQLSPTTAWIWSVSFRLSCSWHCAHRSLVLIVATARLYAYNFIRNAVLSSQLYARAHFVSATLSMFHCERCEPTERDSVQSRKQKIGCTLTFLLVFAAFFITLLCMTSFMLLQLLLSFYDSLHAQ